MQNYTQEYLNKIRSQTREMKGYVTFNGDSTKVLAGNSGLVSLKVHQSAMEEERYCIGSVCSSYCEMTFFNSGLPSGVSLANSYFDAYIGIVMGVVNQVNLEQYTCMGRFYITEISRGKQTTQVVGYDVTSRLNKDYAPTVTKTAQGYLVMDILNDIIDQCGVNNGTHFTDVGNNVYVQQIFEGTCKEQWGWLMSLCNSDGKCYFGSRTDLGMIEGRGYTDGASVYDSYPALDDAVIYLDGYSDGDDFTVNSLTTGTDDSPIVIGNGVGINAPNPYMTETHATEIYNTLHGVTFTPMNLHFRGDMMIDLFDSLKVSQDGTDHRCVVMSIETTFNGGLEQTIECWGDSEEYYAMSSGRMNTIESKVSTNSTLLQEMAQSIETARGGVITQVLDADGTWKELVIANNQDLSQATSVWRFNIAGLAHSTRYTGGTYSFALDDQGRIVANLIQTGVLQDALGKNSWNLDTGAFRITEGSINITTSSETYDQIVLTYGNYRSTVKSGGFVFHYKNGDNWIQRSTLDVDGVSYYDYAGNRIARLGTNGPTTTGTASGLLSCYAFNASYAAGLAVHGGAGDTVSGEYTAYYNRSGFIVNRGTGSGFFQAIDLTSRDYESALLLRRSNGGSGARLSSGNSNDASSLSLYETSGTPRISLYGTGVMSLYNSDGAITTYITPGSASFFDDQSKVRATIGTAGVSVRNNGQIMIYDNNAVLRTTIGPTGTLWQYDDQGRRRTYIEYGDIYLYNNNNVQMFHANSQGRVYPLGSSNYIYDFITEEGTSGRWWYRKWNSGMCELFGSVAAASRTFSAWGSSYVSAKTTAVAYPFTFKSRPREFYAMFGTNSVLLQKVSENTTTQSAEYEGVRAVSGRASFGIDLYVWGELA